VGVQTAGLHNHRGVTASRRGRADSRKKRQPRVPGLSSLSGEAARCACPPNMKKCWLSIEASSEAQHFGKTDVYAEKFLAHPPHRVSGAGRPARESDHLGERELTGHPAAPSEIGEEPHHRGPEMRKALGAKVVKAGKNWLQNAGTWSLMDQDGALYFIELKPIRSRPPVP